MKYLIFAFLFLSGNILAIDCHYSKITAIQAQRGNLLVQVKNAAGNRWKNLGSHGSPSVQSYQSVAQQALASESAIMFRFPDGHDCNTTDYGTVPLAFRMYD